MDRPVSNEAVLEAFGRLQQARGNVKVADEADRAARNAAEKARYALHEAEKIERAAWVELDQMAGHRDR